MCILLLSFACIEHNFFFILEILGCLERLLIAGKQNQFLTWLGTVPVFVIGEPQLIQDIFTSPHCVDKPTWYDRVKDASGDGLFNSRSKSIQCFYLIQVCLTSDIF